MIITFFLDGSYIRATGHDRGYHAVALACPSNERNIFVIVTLKRKTLTLSFRSIAGYCIHLCACLSFSTVQYLHVIEP